MELKDFVKIYNCALPPSICKDLIASFEEHSEQQILSGTGNKERESDYRTAYEMNMSNVEDIDLKFLLSSLNKVVMDYANLYRYEMVSKGLPDFSFPHSNVIEEWRIHRYDQNDHFYKPHIDSIDANSSNRMLAFLFYLNDVDEGGETAFTHHLKGVECKPVRGRVLIFPTWLGFPHEAKRVIEGNKYMLKTYIHYPGELDVE